MHPIEDSLRQCQRLSLHDDYWSDGEKAVAAGIPVIIINAEINQSGLAKAQLVSNNAQGAALGAIQWIESVGDSGDYVELFGAPSDNNAQTRSNGFKTVSKRYCLNTQI